MGLRNATGARKLPVSVRLSFPTSFGPEGNGPRRAVIEIHDETARITLMEIELTPDELMGLFGGSGAYVTASMPRTLDRVGKEMQHDSKTWDDGYTVKVAQARERAESWQMANNWQTLDLRQAHGVWTATGRRWVDPQ